MGALRLFVWEEVLCDYTAGMAYVFAHDETEAREIMKRDFPDYVTRQLPFTACREVTAPEGFFLYGGG